MKFAAAAALLSSALAIPAFALTDGWDFDLEFQSRAWTADTLEWAQDAHPSNPTYAYLIANVHPPPREMWCLSSNPWDEYCGAWNYSMEQYLHHYLDIDYGSALPSNLPSFPKECSSSCSTW